MRGLLKEKVYSIGKAEILEASNGKQAIDIARKEKPDLILLDMVLPDIDGETVLYNLRKGGLESKIIVVSAVGQKPLVERCKKLGISGYFTKPFEDEEIRKQIQNTFVIA